jgi:hypothetical protein
MLARGVEGHHHPTRSRGCGDNDLWRRCALDRREARAEDPARINNGFVTLLFSVS